MEELSTVVLPPNDNSITWFKHDNEGNLLAMENSQKDRRKKGNKENKQQNQTVTI
jgi:hypothetical protein